MNKRRPYVWRVRRCMFTPTLSSETSPLPGNKSAAMNVVCSLCTLDMVNPMITRCGTPLRLCFQCEVSLSFAIGHLYCFDCIDGLIEKNKGSSKALCNFESCGKPLIRRKSFPWLGFHWHDHCSSHLKTLETLTRGTSSKFRSI